MLNHEKKLDSSEHEFRIWNTKMSDYLRVVLTIINSIELKTD